MQEYLEIGKIVNTRGIKGEVKVLPLTDNPERYNDLDWVYIDKKAGLEKYFIKKVSIFKGMVFLMFKEIEDVEAAGKLKDMYIKIDRKNTVELPENSYFICDLIGSDVCEEDGNFLGKLKDVIKTGSNDVYVVGNESDKKILVPALKSVIREVDLDNRRITVTLPEGLV